MFQIAKRFISFAKKTQDIITIKPNALFNIKKTISDTNYIGIKLSVTKKGCSGYSYDMNYATQNDIDSKNFDVIKNDEVSVLIDKKTSFKILGTILDYTDTEISSGYTFTNSNSRGSCGCGESFNI